MRRLVFLVALVALAAATAATAGEPSRIGMPPGAMPWGTWAWRTQVGPDFALPAIVTFHFDGTVTGSDGTMFGGLPGSPTRISPFQGVWGWTSLGRIRGTSLWMTFDAASGLLTGFGRSRSRLELTADGEQLAGVMFLDLLPCSTGPLTCPDPLDPAAVWVPYPNSPPSGLPVTAKRLHRVPPGPLP